MYENYLHIYTCISTLTVHSRKWYHNFATVTNLLPTN